MVEPSADGMLMMWRGAGGVADCCESQLRKGSPAMRRCRIGAIAGGNLIFT